MAFCECHNCKGYRNSKCVLKKPLLKERTYCDFEANEEFVKEETLHEAIKKIRKLRNVPNIYKKEVKEAFKSGMAQAYFDIGMIILNGTHNYKDLQDYCINKGNEIWKKEQ